MICLLKTFMRMLGKDVKTTYIANTVRYLLSSEITKTLFFVIIPFVGLCCIKVINMCYQIGYCKVTGVKTEILGLLFYTGLGEIANSVYALIFVTVVCFIFVSLYTIDVKYYKQRGANRVKILSAFYMVFLFVPLLTYAVHSSGLSWNDVCVMYEYIAVPKVHYTLIIVSSILAILVWQMWKCFTMLGYPLFKETQPLDLSSDGFIARCAIVVIMLTIYLSYFAYHQGLGDAKTAIKSAAVVGIYNEKLCHCNCSSVCRICHKVKTRDIRVFGY